MKTKNRQFIGRVIGTLVIVLMLVSGGFLTVSNWRLIGKIMNSLHDNEKAQVNLNALLEREIDLTKKVENLNTEEGIEREIREKFPVAKPGEEVIMIVDNTDSNTIGGNNGDKIGWWYKFKKWIKEIKE